MNKIWDLIDAFTGLKTWVQISIVTVAVLLIHSFILH